MVERIIEVTAETLDPGRIPYVGQAPSSCAAQDCHWMQFWNLTWTGPPWLRIHGVPVVLVVLYCSISTVVPNIWREGAGGSRRVRKWGHDNDIGIISIISISGISKCLGCAVGYTVFFGRYLFFWDPESKIQDPGSRSRIWCGFLIFGWGLPAYRGLHLEFSTKSGNPNVAGQEIIVNYCKI